MTNGGNHALQQADIERIVRQVLTELTTPKAVAKPNPPSRSDSPVAVTAAELVIDRKVVSLADVQGRLSGVARLVAPRGAVFTPAVRDELRKFGVSVASALAGGKPVATTSPILLAAAETTYEPAALVAALVGESIRVERLPSVGLTRVVDEMCEQIFKGGRRGLLLTSQTAAATCLANRHHGVRCVQGATVRATADAVAAVGANLLVVDPAGKGSFELRSMTRELVRGPGLCPTLWKDLLG